MRREGAGRETLRVTTARSAAAPPPRSPWLFGPASDLLFGCGLVYAVPFAAQTFAGDAMREALPFPVAALAASLFASAHYGATALRAYGSADNRRAHAFWTVWTALLLGALFVTGLQVTIVGSLLVTAYLTWSPWHYAGQNFGVAMTMLRRRGVALTPRGRDLLQWSFIASYLMAAFALHLTDLRASYAPNQLDGGVFTFLSLGTFVEIPDWIGHGAFGLAALVWVLATGGAVVAMRSAGSWRASAPAVLLIAVQALWFAVPVTVRVTHVVHGLEPLGLEHAAYAFVWIGLGHSLQYLWITAYAARREASAAGRRERIVPFALKALLAGSALFWVPALLFSPAALGRLPHDAGLAALVASLVNLHHFILDGVIWKLRDSRVANVLLASQGPARETPAARTPLAAKAALVAGGTALAAVSVAAPAATEWGFNRSLAAGDTASAARVAERLETFGFGSAEQRLLLANAELDAGRLDEAGAHFERSLALHETAWAWIGVGEIHARNGRMRDAGRAFARAMEKDPGHPVAAFRAATVALDEGDEERGKALLERARTAAQIHADATPELRQAIEDVLHDLTHPPR